MRAPPGNDSILCVHDLEIDTSSCTVRRAGVQRVLTLREHALLVLLAARRGKVMTRSVILERLYDDVDQMTPNAVNVLIASLRNKIDRDFQPPLILTCRGRGYMLRDD
jgi:DNA-binding response OmpR family regulator